MVPAEPPLTERQALNLIRSVIGHADGHEAAAVEKIRNILAAATPA